MSAGSSAWPSRLLKIFGKLKSSWTVAPFSQRAFICLGNSCPDGMLIGPGSRPLALRASESRAPLKLREAHEFSCPGGIPLPPSVVVSGRTVAPAGSSSLFRGSHDIPRSSFQPWCLTCHPIVLCDTLRRQTTTLDTKLVVLVFPQIDPSRPTARF